MGRRICEMDESRKENREKSVKGNSNTKKMVKCFFSYHKEIKWLEEMAAQGWFFSNLTLGVIYTFCEGNPKCMVYDIDRFNLSKKPSLEEIRRKEMFMEMAQEMGWQEVTHDSNQNYYFTREYEPDGVNRLHNDEESRSYRAQKFRDFLGESAKRNVFWVMVIAAMDLLIKIYQLFFDTKPLEWFHWFTPIYIIMGMAIALWQWNHGARFARELELTREEWERKVDPATHKVVWKLLWTNHGLNRFLRKQAGQGWILTGVTPVRYFFEKSQGEEQVYTMDSKWLMNRRREAMGQEKIGDSRDFVGLNNDWEIQSVQDARKKGWNFVCALENRSIIYRGEAGKVQPLNDARYDKRLRGISLIGEYGFFLLLSGLAGALIGFFMRCFS